MPHWGGDGCNVHCVPFGAGGCGEGSGALGRAAEEPALAHSSLLSIQVGAFRRRGADVDFSEVPGGGEETGRARAVDHQEDGDVRA